jgi:amidase
MKKIVSLLFFISIVIGCQNGKETQPEVIFKKYDETTALEKQQNHKNKRMQLKLFQSKYLDMNTVFRPFEADLAYF